MVFWFFLRTVKYHIFKTPLGGHICWYLYYVPMILIPTLGLTATLLLEERDEKRIKRSGVNYIDKVHYQRYIDFDDFKNKNEGEYYYFTRYGTKAYSEIDFSDKNKNYYLIFGKESTGIPKEILHNNLDKCYRIPTSENIRALNLSNCVALITYEALRQQNFPNLLRSDPFKGEDYLKKEDGLNQ